jgi:hypothetical protein
MQRDLILMGCERCSMFSRLKNCSFQVLAFPRALRDKAFALGALRSNHTVQSYELQLPDDDDYFNTYITTITAFAEITVDERLQMYRQYCSLRYTYF